MAYFLRMSHQGVIDKIKKDGRYDEWKAELEHNGHRERLRISQLEAIAGQIQHHFERQAAQQGWAYTRALQYTRGKCEGRMSFGTALGIYLVVQTYLDDKHQIP